MMKTEAQAVVEPIGFNLDRVKKLCLAAVSLTKPGISIFIGLTSMSALLFNPSFATLDLTQFFILFLSSYLSSAGSAAFNQYYESDLDRLMERTRQRAIPAGLLSSGFTLFFSAVLLSAGLTLAYVFCGVFPALYLGAGAFSYIVLYTVLSKRRTYWNVPLGGLCGMFAALAGAAGPEGMVSQAGLAFAVLLYFWSAPHFWSLAIYKSQDYRRAGVPMLPVIVGPRKTSVWIFLHTLVLIIPGFFWLESNILGASVAILAGLVFSWRAWKLLRATGAKGDEREREELIFGRARSAFLFSLLYLPAVYLGVWPGALGLF